MFLSSSELHPISSFPSDGVFHSIGSVNGEFGKFSNGISLIGGPHVFKAYQKFLENTRPLYLKTLRNQINLHKCSISFGRVLYNFQKMKYGNFLPSPYFFYRYLLPTLILLKICIWCLVDITFGMKMIFLVKKWLLYWWFPINIRDFLQNRYFRDIIKIVCEDSKSWKRFSSVKKFFAYTRFYWFFTHWLLYRYRNFDIVVTVAKIVQNLL